jgi:hypothetical protein
MHNVELAKTAHCRSHIGEKAGSSSKDAIWNSLCER